jgi:hypothetical protein
MERKDFQWGYIPVGIMGIAIGLIIGLVMSQFEYGTALLIVTIFALGILVGGFIPEIYGMMIAPLQVQRDK